MTSSPRPCNKAARHKTALHSLDPSIDEIERGNHAYIHPQCKGKPAHTRLKILLNIPQRSSFNFIYL